MQAFVNFCAVPYTICKHAHTCYGIIQYISKLYASISPRDMHPVLLARQCMHTVYLRYACILMLLACGMCASHCYQTIVIFTVCWICIVNMKNTTVIQL